MDIKTLLKYGIDENKAKQISEQIEKEIENEVYRRTLEEKTKYEKQIDKFKKINIIEKELILYGARNLKSVLALLDLDDIEFEKFDIEKIRKKIQELKNNENTSFLFFEKEKEPKLKGFKPFDSNLYKEKSIKNMDYEDLCTYYDTIAMI